MRPERKYFKAILGIALIIFTLGLSAQQSIGDAKKIFNEAAEAIKADNKELAIEKLNQCIEICEPLFENEEDEEAEVLMYDAMDKVPKLYYSVAKDKLQAKDYIGGLEAAENAKRTGEEYNDKETAEKASVEIAKIYAKNGTGKLKEKDYNGAIADLDKSIAANADFAPSYQYKALAYKSLEDEVNFKLTSDAGIAAAGRSNDTKTKENIEKQAYSYFYNKGVTEKGSSKYESATKYFTTSLEYNPTSADANYALASVYQSLNKYDEALASADLALGYEETPEGKAKINLLKGQIYKAQNKTAEACEAFSKATVGVYAESAQYEIDHVLKCNETK